MENIILKLGGYDTPHENRERITTYASLMGILSNVVLSLVKVVIGIVSGSVSVLADGVNNVFDVMSAVVTIVGVKLSKRPPDKEHPYGHGRIEYLAAMVICIFVFAVGVQFLIASFKRLKDGTIDSYSNLAFILILLSIAVKVYLFTFYRHLGHKINSTPLIATGTDALGDVLVTSVVMVNIISNKFFHFHVDGIAGIIVSIFIIYSAFSLIKDTVSDIIGASPDENLIKELKKKINSYDHVVDSHDYRIVSFGPEDKFAIVDVELPHEMDIYTAHAIISEIEREVGDEMGIRLIIHIEPQGMTGEKYIKAEEKIRSVMDRLNGFVDFHDLIITSETLSFDAVIDGNLLKSTKERKEMVDRITNEIKKEIPGYKILVRAGERF